MEKPHILGQKTEGASSFASRLIRFIAARKGTVGAILGASLVLNVCGLAIPRLTQAILDRVVPQGDLGLLRHLVLIIVLVTTFQIGLTLWRRLVFVKMSLDIDRAMLGDFCGHLLTLPVQFFKERRAGEVVARFNDGGQVRNFFVARMPGVLVDSLMVIIYLGVMVYYSFSLTLLVAGILVAFAGYTLAIGPRLKLAHRRQLEDKAAHESQLIGIITSIDLVKALAAERVIQTSWDDLHRRYLASNYQMQKMRQLLESVGTSIKFLSTLALVWYGATLVVTGKLTTGQLVAFSMYATAAIVPLLNLITLWDEVQEARVSLERLDEILEVVPEPQGPAEARIDPGQIQGRIQFEDVHFHYYGPGSSSFLKGVNFEIEPGEHVAFVGRSGVGKTTITRLLLGLYRPSQGRVLIDGRDLDHLDLKTYRRQVGVVLQENLLLGGTIRENIGLGDLQPDIDRVVEVAQLAGAREFITALPKGFDTVLGDWGLTLSGGQRQRISLARALYREPRILILDEPTNGMDALSGRHFQEVLENIWGNLTVVIVSHDLATIQWADRRLVLQDGRIVGEDADSRSLFPVS